MAGGSQLFAPFRALGLVCDRGSGAGGGPLVALALDSGGEEAFVVASVGRSLHVYSFTRKLRLLFVRPPGPRRVRALAVLRCGISTDARRGTVGGLRTIHAAGDQLVVTERAEAAAAVPAGHRGAKVRALLAVGDVVLCLGADAALSVWDGSASPVRRLDGAAGVAAGAMGTDFVPSGALCHPATYVNKVVVGGDDGRLQLWNFRTGVRLHVFDRAATAAVSVIEQSPVVDIVAVGSEAGEVTLLNLRSDTVLMSFRIDGSGDESSGGVGGAGGAAAVTALAFRTDGPPLLAVATAVGRVTLWDLERRRVAGVLKSAHRGAVTAAMFLPKEPLLLTAGADNALRVWIFDQPDPAEGRLLRQRSGHMAPPVRVRFLNDHLLLSAGADRALRRTAVYSDALNVEVSQGHLESIARKTSVDPESLRLPDFVDFDCATLREYDWDNVVSCHVGQDGARTWSTHSLAIARGRLAPPPPPPPPAAVECVCLSACGSFAFLGTAAGAVHKFNVQSGLLRGSVAAAHAGAVTAVLTDALSTRVYSCGADCVVRAWDAGAMREVGALVLDAPIYRAALHRASGLLAVVHASMAVRIVDVETLRVVRQLPPLRHNVSDLCFSPDARWLVLATADGTVRVWDLLSARLVDHFRVERPVTSLAFSPSGDLLATAHAGLRAIYLWSNRDYYGQVFLRPVSESVAPRIAAMPAAAGDLATGAEEDGGDGEDGGGGSPAAADEFAAEAAAAAAAGSAPRSEPVAQLAPGSVTLSGLPTDVWTRLPRLEAIRERSRPTEPARKPEAAPFFLPTVPGTKLAFDTAAAAEKDAAPSASRLLSVGGLRLRTQLAELAAAGRYADAVAHLRALPAASVDFELRALDEEADLAPMLSFFADRLESGDHFELVQAALAVFLRVFGAQLAARPACAAACARVERAARSQWDRVHELARASACLVDFCAHPNQ
jgi:U3 small nucleolar RNA-associated protein 21